MCFISLWYDGANHPLKLESVCQRDNQTLLPPNQQIIGSESKNLLHHSFICSISFFHLIKSNFWWHLFTLKAFVSLQNTNCSSSWNVNIDSSSAANLWRNLLTTTHFWHLDWWHATTLHYFQNHFTSVGDYFVCGIIETKWFLVCVVFVKNCGKK